MSEQQLQETNVQPEDRELFAGQNVLVIGGPDAHAMSMAVLSAEWLTTKGASADIYIGSPVIREGEGATHSGALFTKTLPKLDVARYDRVVIVDIPLNTHDMEGSKAGLVELGKRINEYRHTQNAAPLVHPVIYVDHHSTTALEVESISLPGVLVKQVDTAQECRVGSTPSIIARIGAICDREESVLPVTEEEMMLAKGFDSAVRPAQDDPKPAKPEVIDEAYMFELRAWEDRAQTRLNVAVIELQNGNLEYFKKEAEKLITPLVPVASGFGNVIIVDTQGLTQSFTIYKLMESAVENSGVDTSPYAIAVIRNLKDEKLGREPADVVTVIRHWTRSDLPTVEDVLGAELSEQYHAYGAPNARSMRLPVDEQNTSRVVSELLKKFSGVELPDFSQIKSVVMCGDPNSGKSVFSTILREALKNFGMNVSHLDLDKAAPTPIWYLEAEVAVKSAEVAFGKGQIKQEQLDSVRKNLEEAATKRRAMKRTWNIELAQEAKEELLAESQKDGVDFVIGDIGGGRIFKDEQGEITKIQRLTAENARILEGTDAVIVVSSNPAGAAEWVKLVTEGTDPETGVTMRRDKPLVILGVYQSVLEGAVQKVAGTRNEAGVITNLDRSLTDRIYNPSIVATALMVRDGVEKRSEVHVSNAKENWRPWQECMTYGSERFSTVAANNHNIILLGEGTGVEKLVLGKDVALVLPENPADLDPMMPYPTHQDAWLPMGFVLAYHSQGKTPQEQSYRQAVWERMTDDDKQRVQGAILWQAKMFWDEYKKADTTGLSSRKQYKPLTRILQDIMLYMDMPEPVMDQEAYLAGHSIQPLIAAANELRNGINLDKAHFVEELIESRLTGALDSYGLDKAQAAHRNLTEQLNAKSGTSPVFQFPDRTIADVKEMASLARHDLIISEDEHDCDVISIVPGIDEPRFYQLEKSIGAGLKTKKRVDVIAVPPTLDIWDVVKGGKDSCQPISMIIVTHTTARTVTGERMLARLQKDVRPQSIAHHYLGAAEEFLHRHAWGKNYVERAGNPSVKSIKQVIPLYRVACDLLPRAVYMLKTGNFPAGVELDELWKTGEIAREAHKIEELFERQDCTQEELTMLYASVKEVFTKWYSSEDYDAFRTNIKNMGSNPDSNSHE